LSLLLEVGVIYRNSY